MIADEFNGLKDYVLCSRNEEYFIVGPFESDEQMKEWGDHEYNNGDDPRWQSIRLKTSNLMPSVHGPDWHPNYTP